MFFKISKVFFLSVALLALGGCLKEEAPPPPATTAAAVPQAAPEAAPIAPAAPMAAETSDNLDQPIPSVTPEEAPAEPMAEPMGEPPVVAQGPGAPPSGDVLSFDLGPPSSVFPLGFEKVQLGMTTKEIKALRPRSKQNEFLSYLYLEDTPQNPLFSSVSYSFDKEQNELIMIVFLFKPEFAGKEGFKELMLAGQAKWGSDSTVVNGGSLSEAARWISPEFTVDLELDKNTQAIRAIISIR